MVVLVVVGVVVVEDFVWGVYVGVRPAVELGEQSTGVLFSGHLLDPLERAC